MADPCFSHPRLARVYDALDGPRDDLRPYLELVSELGAHSVLDVGCGTGALACTLAGRGLDVTGIDPADASITVAESKPYADRVRWIVGEADAFDGPVVDLVTMTGNVAQVFVPDHDWARNLAACRAAVRTGGWVALESRDPTRRAWLDWTPERTSNHVVVPGSGGVHARCEVINVDLPLVSFRWTYTFDEDGAVLHSDSTLRFRTREELRLTLTGAGFAVREIRDAPDRPGAELVFIAEAI